MGWDLYKDQPFSKVLFTLDDFDLDSLRLKTSQNNDSFVSAYQVKRTPLKDKTMNYMNLSPDENAYINRGRTAWSKNLTGRKLKFEDDDDEDNY